jgi:hypothetical protein
MNQAKCLDQVIEAVTALDPSVHLVITGRTIADYDPRSAIEAATIGGRAIVAADVSDDEFLGWIAAADVVVDLRHPHRGEVSGTLLRAMQVGRPTIVSGVGSYLDLPDETVVRITPGIPDARELSSTIRRLSEDASLRDRIGAVARHYIDRLQAADAAPRAYADAIVATLGLIQDPTEVPMRRWAEALAEIGVTERELALGHGLAYARTLDGFKRSP